MADGEPTMTRAEMVALAQSAAEAIKLPAGGRAVVVLTDADGEFIGVGTTTSDDDTWALLVSAVAGTDRQEHPEAVT